MTDLFNLSNWHEEKFTCCRHGEYTVAVAECDTGYIPECPKCEEERKRREAFELAAKKNKELYALANIEPEYWHMTFDDYKATTESQKLALEAVKNIFKVRGKKVVLLGGNGVGKTMLGSIAVRSGCGSIYSMYEITTMIRQSYTPKAKKTELEIVDELARIPLLVIDELGRTKGSDSELNWLSYIIDKRHTRGLPLIILSNTHLMRDCKSHGCEMCFERFVNNDVLSRLRENSTIITINAPDYRARGERK